MNPRPSAFFATLLLSLAIGCSSEPLEPADSPEPTQPNGPSLAPRVAVYDTAYDLTAMSGGQMGHAWDISQRGLVVGDQDGLPFTWEYRLGRYRALPLTASGFYGAAQAVSSDGRWIAGYVDNHAVIWDPSRQPVDIGTLGGTNSVAYGIDRNGNAVGWSYTVSGIEHAFLYQQSSHRLIDLGLIPGAAPTSQTLAYDINDNGEVVGCGQNSTGNLSMFMWTRRGMVDLGAPPYGYACALAISMSGWIAGWGGGSTGDFGFSWSKKTGFVSHGAAYAQDINVNAIAAGYFQSYHGYVADRKGQIQLLPEYLSWSASFAEALNDCGDVVGEGSGQSVTIHAVLWPSGSC